MTPRSAQDRLRAFRRDRGYPNTPAPVRFLLDSLPTKFTGSQSILRSAFNGECNKTYTFGYGDRGFD